jgi:DNA-binding response OmpR family regulator
MKKTILIVDDTPENLKMLYKILRYDYEVLGASGGEEALRLMKSTQPDMVLLDVMMPEMSGFEVCRHIKADESIQDIPVIFITALTEEPDETQGFELGAVEYITKPFKPAILRHRINTHLKLKAQRDELAEKNAKLTEALAQVKELSGLLPICMTCKKIRDDKGYWNQLEAYITQHSKALFSHSYCPTCGEIALKALDQELEKLS